MQIDAPIVSAPRKVPADWIDYNGHMNVSYYSMAFDQAIDDIFENILGIGESYTAETQHGPYVLQNNLHYLDELLEGAEFKVQFQLINHDAKRLHLFLCMTNAAGDVAATSEQIIMNVDLTARRSAVYPKWVLDLLGKVKAAHDILPRPTQLGAPMGLRRKG